MPRENMSSFAGGVNKKPSGRKAGTVFAQGICAAEKQYVCRMDYILKDTSRKSGTCTWSDRDTSEVPDNHEYDPEDFQNDSNRDKTGNKSAKFKILEHSN